MARTQHELVEVNTGSSVLDRSKKKEDFKMESVTIIRVVAGVLFVIVLGILVQRRRTSVN
jgi:hypothetical protein